MNKKIRDEFEELPLEIIEEKWNEYKFADGGSIRARPIILKVFWPSQLGKLRPNQVIDLRGSFEKIIVPFCTKEMEGVSKKMPPMEEVLQMDKTTRESVRIISSEEHWNVYKLPGERGDLKIKMVVSEIYHIKGYFDENGTPCYIVNSSLVMTPSL